MKRITAIVMAAMLMTILSVSTVFAAASDGFQLEKDKCSPTDGYKKVEATNVMVKLYFTDDVSAKETQKANKDMFKFTDGDGKKVDFDIYYNSKDPKNVNLLAKNDLDTETDYTITISGDLTDDEGNILGADETMKFSTRKPASSGTYMLLMLAMMVVMVVMTVRDQRKSSTADDVKAQAQAIQTNPYRLAKEKGISVEEAQKLINEEKAKIAKKAEKAEKNAQKNGTAASAPKHKKKNEKPQKKVYKVKTKRIVKKH